MVDPIPMGSYLKYSELIASFLLDILQSPLPPVYNAINSCSHCKTLIFSQEDFVKTLPGMERKINEHIVGFSFPPMVQCGSSAGGSVQVASGGGGVPGSRASTATVAVAPPEMQQQQQQHEVPLLKGSFGHHMVGSHSQDSIYGLDSGRGGVMQMGPSSESANSVLGLTSTSHCHADTIPVTAEIAVQPPQRSSVVIPEDELPFIQQQQQQSFGFVNGDQLVADPNQHLHHHHHHRGGHHHHGQMVLDDTCTPAGVPPPPPPVSSRHSMTLPRNLDLSVAPPPPSTSIKRGSYSGPTPVIPPVIPPATTSAAAAAPQLHLNGNGDIGSDSGSSSFNTYSGGGSGVNGAATELTQLTNGCTSPPSRAALAAATLPRNGSASILQQNGKRKKSVTIGPTFTTVEENAPAVSNGGEKAANGEDFSSAV